MILKRLLIFYLFKPHTCLCFFQSAPMQGQRPQPEFPDPFLLTINWDEISNFTTGALLSYTSLLYFLTFKMQLCNTLIYKQFKLSQLHDQSILQPFSGKYNRCLIPFELYSPHIYSQSLPFSDANATATPLSAPRALAPESRRLHATAPITPRAWVARNVRPSTTTDPGPAPRPRTLMNVCVSGYIGLKTCV